MLSFCKVQILSWVMNLKDNRKDKEVPVQMFMMLAQDARTINEYGALGPAGQQSFMERFSHAKSVQDEQRLIEELTK